MVTHLILGEDFSLFLEEAKQHAKETSNLHFESSHPETISGKNLQEAKKSKKSSWRQRSLFSWWKTSSSHEKKTKQAEESVHRHPHFARQNTDFSGPVQGSNSSLDIKQRRRPTSGPIKSFFNPVNKVDNINDMAASSAYVCLGKQLSCSGRAQSYGPVYSVS